MSLPDINGPTLPDAGLAAMVFFVFADAALLMVLSLLMAGAVWV
jgi:hypothetical protein